MATLQELADLPSDASWGLLVDRVAAAGLVKASDIINLATSGAEAKDWAILCLSGPRAVANTLVYGVIGLNSTASVAQIFSATDTVVKNNVSTVVDKLYGV